jgi:alkanesulfonate monooxygenase SsuD/methylene tetrahydromethanopterin reductase-like flavin-dependent oxidoreductase (luciferase family)
MEIGVGLDVRLRLSYPELRSLAREAVGLGYESAWTTSNVYEDAFQTCAQWSIATQDLVQGGIKTGIGVVPVPLWTPTSLAIAGGTLGKLTGGRFVLGLGCGNIGSEAYRHAHGLAASGPISLMRDYLTVLRQMLAGEPADYAGRVLQMHGARIDFTPPPVPRFVGALGPQMLRLSGQLADGIVLNWCTPEQVAWARERVSEGAEMAGRSPSEVTIGQYIRVCVDEDPDAARRGLTRALLRYALRLPGSVTETGYRRHFGRMGFEETLTALETRWANGASEAEIVDAFPPDLVRKVGYFGSASGAAAGVRHLAEGLDLAIVRVIAARPGADAVLATMQACRPSLVGAEARTRRSL